MLKTIVPRVYFAVMSQILQLYLLTLYSEYQFLCFQVKFSLVYVELEGSCEKPNFSQPKRQFKGFLLEEGAEEP